MTVSSFGSSFAVFGIILLSQIQITNGTISAKMKLSPLFSLTAAACLHQAPAMLAARSSSAGRVRGVSSSAAVQRRVKGEESPDERECEFEYKPDKVEFECKAKTEDEETEIKDEIEYKVKTGDKGLSVKVEYESEIETEEVETETETQFEVFFHGLLEFASSTGEDAFDWENDEVIQNITLLNYGSFSEIETDSEGIVSTFSVMSTDVGATFTFTISRSETVEGTSTAVSRSDTPGQNLLTANQMKIDFSLEDFAWVRNDTYVALVTTIESKKEVEVEYEDGTKEKAEDVVISFNEAIEGTGTTAFGEFTWETTAIVNETNATVATTTAIEVIATSPETQPDEKSQEIAFSFVGESASYSSFIYWDPEAGVGYSSAATGYFVAPMAVIVGSMSAFALVL